MTREDRKVILASSVGTVFEWYDFYLAGALAANIGATFFSGVNPTAGFIFTLLGFAAGFAVRPFGALFFGSLGDLIGRKYTFLVTMTLMGISTFVVGLLPTYASIGFTAPVLFIVCRLVQGLALGGEYGGAATYVAEHAPQGRRGFYTSWIQTTATVGLFLSLIVVLVLRLWLTPAQFADWGWRVPFLLSILLLGVSIWIRLQLEELPAFQRIKDAGKGSKTPLREAFGTLEERQDRHPRPARRHRRPGRGVVLRPVLRPVLPHPDAEARRHDVQHRDRRGAGDRHAVLRLLRLAVRQDRPQADHPRRLPAGRRHLLPAIQALTNAVNPQLEQALEKSPVVVTADPGECSFQFNPTGTASFTSSCDIAKSFLARNSVNYSNVAAPAGTPATIKIGDKVITSFDKVAAGAEAAAKEKAFNDQATAAIRAAGYPAAADPAKVNMSMAILILAILVLYVTMVYGPIAAMLVELFPTRIRYSGMSLPYHIGNGWFGGFLPPTAFAIVAATGNIYSGLWYPIVIAGMTFVIGLFFMPETKDRDIYANDN